MKKRTIFSLAFAGALGLWGYHVTAKTGDQTWMENHIRKTGREAACTKTEGASDRTWLACRIGDGSHNAGSVWTKDENADGNVWIAANGKAIEIIRRLDQVEPDWREKTTLTMRLRETSDGNIPVPWDRLN